MKQFFPATRVLPVVLLLIVLCALVNPVRELRSQSTGTQAVDTTEDYQALGYSDSRKVVADAQGRLYVAYRKKFRQAQALKYHIFVARSTDSGVTWTVLNQGRPVESVGDYTQRVPSLAVDRSDGLHLVWYGEDVNTKPTDERQIKYVRSTDGGATWSTWQNVAPVPGYTTQTLWQEHPVIDAAGDGNLYIAWQGRDATYPADSQIKVIRSTDGGATWSAWSNVNPATGRYFSRPSLVAAPDGSVLYLMAYSGTVSTFAQLLWTTSTDGGATWSAWSAVTPSDQDQRHFSLVVDSGGRLHLAWRQRPTGAAATVPTQIHYAMWANNRWSAPVVVGASATNYQFFPSLTMGRDGRRWLTWLENPTAAQFPADDPTTGTIYYTTQAAEATTWSAPAQLRPATTDLYPTLGWYTKSAQPQQECDRVNGVELLWLESIMVDQNRVMYTCLALPTPTPTATATAAPTATNTPVPTATATNTPVPTATATNTPVPPPTATNTATSTATNTSLPPATATATATATSTATNTAVPTATATSVAAAFSKILLSSQVDGRVGTVSYSDEDLLTYTPATGAWTILFDGSDVGLANVDLKNFQLRPDNALLMSFDARLTLPGAGTVERSDIVKFTPTSLGANTAGSWSLYFDGSDVGLADTGEYLDGIGIDAAGRLLISTEGTFKVGSLTAQDEDLLAFTATSWGSTTSGSWQLYFDGSDVALDNGSEDVNSVALRNGNLYLTTVGAFAAVGATSRLSGDQNELFVCTPLTLGNDTKCNFALVFDGNGLLSDIDALSLDETYGLAAVQGVAAASVDDATFDATAQYPILPAETLTTTVDPELDAYDQADPNSPSTVDETSLIFKVFMPVAAR